LVAVSLLLLAVGVGAAWYVQRMRKNVSHELLINVSSMRAAEEVEILIREIRTQFDHFLMTGDRKYLQASPLFRAETDRWLTVAERYSITPREQDLMGKARVGYQRFLTELDQLPGPNDRDGLEKRVRGLIDVLVHDIQEPTHDYLDFNEVEVEAAIAQDQAQADWLVYGLLSLGICGCGAGLATGFGIARGISRSLIQLSMPIRAAAGQLEAVVGPLTFEPGTDLHQLEGVLHAIAEQIGAVVERLRQSEREVLRREQLAAVGQMAAGMAHELRNPLTAMKLLVQGAMVRDNSDGPNHEPPPPGAGLAGRDLRILEEEISRVEALIHSFLQFARPPALEKRKVDVCALVEQTVRLVSVRAGQRGSRLECVVPETALQATLDPGQFRQVLLNLLLNALDVVPAGGLVCVRLETDSTGQLSLEVSDTGRGLPAALGSRIFAPFVTTKETGLGLGLSICKRIVEAHGGAISAANRPEGGAVFTVRLPLGEGGGTTETQRHREITERKEKQEEGTERTREHGQGEGI
jgi:signal transduction histidine kinase